MKKTFIKTVSAIILIFISGLGGLNSQNASFNVVPDKPLNGTFKVDPPLPSDGKYAAGTVVTVTSTPDKGFVFDGGYFSVTTARGQRNMEFSTTVAKVTIDQDKHIGATFIDKKAVDHINVTEDVVYAKPGIKPLKYDVYSPKGAKNLPVIVIIHGGGWSSNNEDVMRGLARELTKGGQYVVFSIDYRWARKGDGDATNTSMANIIEDVFGAIAHIMEHAAEYGGDATNIAVTGDSAGGHLSAAVSVMADKIGKGGFGKTPGVFEFMPTYMPKNKTVEQVRAELMAAIKAAAPSYGVFGGTLLNHFSDDPAANDSWKDAIAPLSNIPDAKVREVPTYLTRGTKDQLIKDEAVKIYADSLVSRGHRVEYVQVGGAGHAFFDWKTDDRTKATFVKYGVYYAAEMKAFFNSVFYKKQ